MSDANADQLDFWNAEPGQFWVKFQPDLEAIHGNVTDVLMAACAPREGEHVADIGCGAGGSSFMLAGKVGPSGHVTGVDVSEPLLRQAELRRDALGASNVSFGNGDAQDHPFPPEAFDLVASRFGVMFFADPVAAFRNMVRATRKGGRIVFVAWAGSERNPWFRLPQKVAVDHLGPVPAVPPEAPGPMAFRNIDRVVGLLEAAGFADCSGEAIETDLHHPGGVDAIIGLASHVGPAARVVRAKGGSAEDHDIIMQKVAEDFQQFRAADGVRIPACINVFSAHRR